MNDNLQFEEALQRLEALTTELESGESNLDDTIRCYEECMALVKLCNDRLDAYEKTITRLSSLERSM